MFVLGEDGFMFENHYPDEYVQMALLNQAVSDELAKMFKSDKNPLFFNQSCYHEFLGYKSDR